MKYVNPEMEIILLYESGILTISLGPLEPEDKPGTGTGEGEGIVIPGVSIP